MAIVNAMMIAKEHNPAPASARTIYYPGCSPTFGLCSRPHKRIQTSDDFPLVVSFVQSTLPVRRAAAASRIDAKTLRCSIHQGPWPWEIKGA